MSLPSPISTSTLRDTVTQDLRDKIERNELPAGTRLPSYAALAVRYGVSDITVRAAVRALMDSGYVWSRRGSGLFVCDPLPSDAIDRPVPPTRGLLNDIVCVLTQKRVTAPRSGKQQGYGYFITDGAVQAIHQRGLHTLELNPGKFWTGAGVLNTEEAERLLALRPGGVIITAYDVLWPEAHAKMLNSFKGAGVPVSVYGSMPHMAAHDCVVSDQEQGAHDLAVWLLKRGRKRIGFAVHSKSYSYWYALRRQGYERAMEEAGLEPLPTIEIPIDFNTGVSIETFRRGARIFAGYLAEHLTGASPLDALMLPSDGAVYPAAAACRLLSRQPNVDVELVGYDNYWIETPDMAFEETRPLASVDKNNIQAGRALVDLLLERSAGNLPPEPQRWVIPANVVPVDL